MQDGDPAATLRLGVRSGSKGEEHTVSITSPLCGAKAESATRFADFAFGPIPDIDLSRTAILLRWLTCQVRIWHLAWVSW